MISYYASSSEPAQVRGKTVYLQYSNRQEIVNNKTTADVAGNVLLVTIEGNDARLVSIDVLHLVSSNTCSLQTHALKKYHFHRTCSLWFPVVWLYCMSWFCETCCLTTPEWISRPMSRKYLQWQLIAPGERAHVCLSSFSLLALSSLLPSHLSISNFL